MIQKKYIIIFFTLVKMSFKAQFQYKLDIFVKSFTIILELLVNVLFFIIIFHHTSKIVGWQHHEILCFIFTFDLMKNVLCCLFVKNLSKIEDILVNGQFDYYLTQPINSLFFISIKQISLPHLMHIIVPLLLLTFNIYLVFSSLDLYIIMVFAYNIFCGLIVTYSIWIILMSNCFFLIRIKALHELFLELISLGKYPKAIYNLFIQTLLTYVIPLLFLSSIPAESLLTFQNISQVPLIVALTTFIIACKFWKISLNSYESVGG